MINISKTMTDEEWEELLRPWTLQELVDGTLKHIPITMTREEWDEILGPYRLEKREEAVEMTRVQLQDRVATLECDCIMLMGSLKEGGYALRRSEEFRKLVRYGDDIAREAGAIDKKIMVLNAEKMDLVFKALADDREGMVVASKARQDEHRRGADKANKKWKDAKELVFPIWQKWARGEMPELHSQAAFASFASDQIDQAVSPRTIEAYSKEWKEKSCNR